MKALIKFFCFLLYVLILFPVLGQGINYTNSSFGENYITHLNNTYSSDGNIYSRLGNISITTNGEIYLNKDNNTYCSDGTTYTRIGNYIYSTDGKLMLNIVY